MSDKKTTNNDRNEQRLVVENKKYKKGDVLAFVLCLLAAVAIWIYASNVELEQDRIRADVSDNISEASEQK